MARRADHFTSSIYFIKYMEETSPSMQGVRTLTKSEEPLPCLLSNPAGTISNCVDDCMRLFSMCMHIIMQVLRVSTNKISRNFPAVLSMSKVSKLASNEMHLGEPSDNTLFGVRCYNVISDMGAVMLHQICCTIAAQQSLERHQV